MRASNEYPSMRHSMMAFERFAADELKARASDLYWTGERYQNGPMQACWTVWQHCCTITPKPQCFGSNPGAQAQAENDCETCRHAKPCHSTVPSPTYTAKDVQHMLAYNALNAPTQESRDNASKRLAELAVPSPKPKDPDPFDDFCYQCDQGD